MHIFGKNVALVLSGGGARGMAHIGVIEELVKRGYHIHSISGTSMGALVGGVYALGKMPEFKEWLCTLDMFKVFSLFDFTFSWQGFVKGDKVLRAMREFIPDKNIQDLDISYCAVAADIVNKREILFREGSVYNAIRASMSIPTVFTPIKTADGLLVDGGIINNMPLNRVKRKFGDELVAVNINANVPKEKNFSLAPKEKATEQNIYFKKIGQWQSYLQSNMPQGLNETLSSWGNSLHKFFDEDENEPEKTEEEVLSYFDIVNESIDLMIYHITRMTLENSKQPDILIEISRDACGTFDFHKAQEVIENGRQAAIRALDE